MVIAFHTLDRKINLSENITKTLEILYEIIISACDWYKEKYCTVWEGDPLDYLEQEDLLWPDDASIKSKVIISYGESTLNDLNINTVIYIDPDNTLKDVPPIFISFNPPAVSDIDLLVLLDECIDILEESAKVLWLRLLDFPIENSRLVISETSDAILDLYVPRKFHAEKNLEWFSRTLAKNIRSVFKRRKPYSRPSTIPLEDLIEISDEEILDEREQISLEKFCIDLLTKEEEKEVVAEKYFTKSIKLESIQGSLILSELEPDGIREEIISLSKRILKGYKMYPTKDEIIERAASIVLE